MTATGTKGLDNMIHDRLTNESARELIVMGKKYRGILSWLNRASAVKTFDGVMGFPSTL